MPALESFPEDASRVLAVVKSLVVRGTPLTAAEANSSGIAGFIVCEAVDGGMFLTAGLAHGSADMSPPNEGCRGFRECFGVCGEAGCTSGS